MNKNSTPALLIPFAALLAVAFPFAFNYRQPASLPLPEAPAPEHVRSHSLPPANAASRDKEQTPEVHEVKRILRQFFGIRDLRQALDSYKDGRRAYHVDFMIATVPDPIESRLPYLFDRFLASIQRAAEANHLMLDSYDLPWLEEKRTDIGKEGTAFDEATPTGAVPPHLHGKEPGLLLFRDAYSSKGPRLLVLFLVGETPTTGISREAFKSALRQIAELRSTVDPSSSSSQLQIPILGPSFSGTAESLDFTLEEWLSARHQSPDPQGSVQFQIVTGSATAIPTARRPAENGRWYFKYPSELGSVRFQSTVVPDDTVTLPRFLDFLKDKKLTLRSRPVTVAFLTEGNTAYGAAIKSALSSRFRGGENNGCKPPAQTEVETISLPFPLHISRLRSEAEKSRRAHEQGAQQVNTNTDSTRYLPVPFEDESGNATDSIPVFSDLDTSSSELILSNLLSTISHEQFDYVGIAATDVRDTIFLAREIREHSPSSVIFSFNADLLYTHPEANPNTRGMLVVTPYPLFTLNQHWMDPFDLRRSRLQFPDQNSEGEYNAMLLLLRGLWGGQQSLQRNSEEGEPLLEYGVPFDVSSQNSQHSPPVWITTVGRQGFWPVAVLPALPSKDKDDYTYSDGAPGDKVNACVLPDLNRGMIPHFAMLVYFFWSVLCLVPALVFLRRYAQERFPDSKFLAWGFGLKELHTFRDATFSRNRKECRAYYLVGGIAALSAYLVAVTAYALTVKSVTSSFSSDGRPFDRLFLAAMLVLLALSFVSCVLLMRDTFSLTRGSGTQSTDGWLGYPVLFISVAALGLAAWLSVNWLSLHDPQQPGLAETVNRVITGYRVLHLLSGVSPLPPLFLIALAACVWSYSAVRRVRLTESLPWRLLSECKGQSDRPSDKDQYALFNSSNISFKAFWTLESEVQELLRNPSLQLPGNERAVSFAIVGAILAAGVYLFYLRLVTALESPSFYFLFGICFLLVYLSIAFNTMRLFFLWLSLRKILHALDRHPVRAAFARFHRSFPSLPRISLAAAPSPMTALNFSIQQAAALLRSAKFLPQATSSLVGTSVAAKAHIDEAEMYYRRAVDSEARKERCKCLIAQLGAQRALARASCLVEDTLERVWNDEPTSATPDPAIEQKRKSLVEEAEEFLVGRTVLFLAHIFPQMTNLAGLSLASLMLLLVAVSSYPFQPHQLIVIFNWLLIFAFVGVALYMSVQMNRDTLLSNLNGSKPGELNWDGEFITRIFVYVVVPILGFLGVQFPDALALIFSFLSPGAAGHG